MLRTLSIPKKTKFGISSTINSKGSARCSSTLIQEWRTTFEDYAKQHNIYAQDWYQLDIKQIPNLDEKTFENRFKKSLYKVLSTVFPEVEWHPWKFKYENVPPGFWRSTSNQRKFFDDLGKKIGVNTPDDWYEKLSLNIIKENGGRGLLNWNNSSPTAALLASYPEHNWILSKFNSVPQGHWKDVDNQRKFFDNLGNKLGINNLEDWYDKLSSQVLLESGGRGLMRHYNDSPMDALMTAYSEHNWIPCKFKFVSMGFWQEPANHKFYFDYLGQKLGITNMDDWYDKLSVNTIIENGGGHMLNKMFHGSPTAALMAAYPQHNWILWKFKVPKDFWKDVANQRKFFDYLGKQLGVNSLDDWYEKLSAKTIKSYGGRGLLELYRQSPMTALKAAYPDHTWIPWKFHGVTQEWNSKGTISQLLTELSEKLSIQTLDDWYRVDHVQLHQFGALKFVMKNKGLYEILKEQYPHHPWDVSKFQQKGGKKAQRWLAVTLKKIFPNEEILEDYNHPKVVHPSSNRPMQLDVFIPSKNLAFEYQGKQHFDEVGIFSSAKSYQQRDEEKRTLCASNNIKLIEVPYWWNRTQQSLQEMIMNESDK